MQITQGKPSERSDDGDFARQLLALLGTAYNGPDGSNNAADALAMGGALADVRAVLSDALDEAFVDSAWDTLSELETEYGLPVRTDLTQPQRQSRLLAKVRAARAGSPQDILRAVRVYDPTATLLENTCATVAGDSDTTDHWGANRGVYQFALKLSAAVWNDAGQRAAIAAIVEQMKPATAGYSLCVNANFLCDDPNSLCDRDVLGS